ncbi:MAG: ParM/StbA family protein [Pseudomonadales bacterium]
MIKKQQILVLDIGNGRTKGIGGNRYRCDYPSHVLPYTKGSLAESFGAKPFKCSLGHFIVGDQCVKGKIATKSTDSSFYESDVFRICLLKAVKDSGVKTPYLVTGLPKEHYDRLHTGLEANIRKWCKSEGMSLPGIVIMKQQLALFFDPMIEDQDGNKIPSKILLNGKVGLLDGGYGTTDLGTIIDGIPNEDKEWGESTGVSDIHKKLFAALSNPAANQIKKSLLPTKFELSPDINEYTMDTWIRQGHIVYCGEKILLKPILSTIVDKFVADVLSRGIKSAWGNTKFMTGVINAGGLANITPRDLLEKYIECPIWTPSEPEMSVVRGYYEYAVAKLTKSKTLAPCELAVNG